ncbi:hypothetical protein B0H11DRAFT_1920427 [Mycena galericulata]|nr:hypothetical protein B0H11DRAFT_1920427 [Mycena galericulata]
MVMRSVAMLFKFVFCSTLSSFRVKATTPGKHTLMWGSALRSTIQESQSRSQENRWSGYREKSYWCTVHIYHCESPPGFMGRRTSFDSRAGHYRKILLGAGKAGYIFTRNIYSATTRTWKSGYIFLFTRPTKEPEDPRKGDGGHLGLRIQSPVAFDNLQREVLLVYGECLPLMQMVDSTLGRRTSFDSRAGHENSIPLHFLARLEISLVHTLGAGMAVHIFTRDIYARPPQEYGSEGSSIHEVHERAGGSKGDGGHLGLRVEPSSRYHSSDTFKW